jgi:ketosteroid isomerase-like protein
LLATICGAVLSAGPAAAGPTNATAQGALATDAAISHALQSNDATTLHGLLASDWIVVSARGGWDGRDDILRAVKTGVWTHTMAVTSKPRVRVYGTTAVVTEHAAVSGMSMHKPYVNVQECQTDVLVWKGNGWVSELLHESYSKDPSSNC